ncbi:MAG: GDP-mannose 4,6-dehydratase, partial [Anaerolineales bacterium]
MSKKYLITGGAGFIGCNYVARLLARGESVIIYDNLTRVGASRNLKWLRDSYGISSFEFIEGDVRDSQLITKSAHTADVIVHLAGQVAVTTSVENPREDFESNAVGTFNVLEAARLSGRQPVVIYASSNKVYGEMDNIGVIEEEKSYRYANFPYGVSESFNLDFHSPYGCSKGAGDQYVRDYSRIYGLPAVVFRQSCIYGPRQFGIEDQGWVAWFMIAAVMGRPITVNGNGKQVRDVLSIDDLLDGYDEAIEHINIAAGQVYNIGGGPENTLAIWLTFRPILEELVGHEIVVLWDDWRPGDQRIYISDIRKANRELNWYPRISVKTGIRKLYSWVQ